MISAAAASRARRERRGQHGGRLGHHCRRHWAGQWHTSRTVMEFLPGPGAGPCASSMFSIVSVKDGRAGQHAGRSGQGEARHSVGHVQSPPGVMDGAVAMPFGSGGQHAGRSPHRPFRQLGGQTQLGFGGVMPQQKGGRQSGASLLPHMGRCAVLRVRGSTLNATTHLSRQDGHAHRVLRAAVAARGAAHAVDEGTGEPGAAGRAPRGAGHALALARACLGQLQQQELRNARRVRPNSIRGRQRRAATSAAHRVVEAHLTALNGARSDLIASGSRLLRRRQRHRRGERHV
jgi:hypothetical protein